MRWMTVLSLLILAFAASAGCALAENARPQILPGMVLVLPDKLTNVLESRLPAYRVPMKEDYWSANRYDSCDAAAGGHDVRFNVMWNEVSDTAIPYACWGDFNGDGLTDVALMLISTGNDTMSDGMPRWKLVIFHQTKGGYDIPPLEELMQYADPYIIIDTRPPGLVKPFSETDDAEPVRIKHDMIDWYYWGKAGGVLYWDGKQYQEITTID